MSLCASDVDLSQGLRLDAGSDLAHGLGLAAGLDPVEDLDSGLAAGTGCGRAAGSPLFGH
jgi:hypothetical protein